MDRVAIIGLGLMGGSLGLALKARRWAGRVTGFSRSASSRRAAVERGAVDEVFERIPDAVREATLAVFCAPVLSIPGLVREALPHLTPGAVVTDVGSTKAFLVNSLDDVARKAGCEFVGSHPVAGSEKQGMGAAREDLYERAMVVITPGAQAAPEAVARVRGLWTAVGATTCEMIADEHDAIIARTSHLPHLVAALLASTVGRKEPMDAVSALCGGGFRDTTRVAEGSPEMWRDILATNREAVMEELQAYGRSVEEFVKLLRKNDLAGIAGQLARSRDLRQRLLSLSITREGEVV